MKGDIQLGNTPTNIDVNPITKLVYVTNMQDNSVSVIDGKTNSVMKGDIQLGNTPTNIDVNPITNLLYVTSLNSNSVSLLPLKPR